MCAPCPSFAGMSKILAIAVNHELLAKFTTWIQFRPSLTEVSHAAWCGAPLVLNDGTHLGRGMNTISLHGCGVEKPQTNTKKTIR
jgi:hypothetical protein